MYEWRQRRLSDIICRHGIQSLMYGPDSLVSQVWFGDATGVRLTLQQYTQEENKTLFVPAISVVA